MYDWGWKEWGNLLGFVIPVVTSVTWGYLSYKTSVERMRIRGEWEILKLRKRAIEDHEQHIANTLSLKYYTPYHDYKDFASRCLGVINRVGCEDDEYVMQFRKELMEFLDVEEDAA